jgi:hypothetical protein
MALRWSGGARRSRTPAPGDGGGRGCMRKVLVKVQPSSCVLPAPEVLPDLIDDGADVLVIDGPFTETKELALAGGCRVLRENNDVARRIGVAKLGAAVERGALGHDEPFAAELLFQLRE